MEEKTMPAPDHGCYTDHGVSGYGVAAKLTRVEKMEEAFIKDLAEKMMVSIAEKCMARGAKCIGHIKSHIRTEAGTVKADTIGVGHGAYSTGAIPHPVDTLYVAINTIIQGVAESEAKEATLEGMHEAAEGRGLVVEKEKEHTYFDEFDFTANKKEYIRQLEEQLAELEAGEDGGP